ncbi:hypothetical protein F3F96_04685 [Mariprofundus sp. NF]|uniref:hypothetical protein n=1 Tax=Mariprofundus sp. NF TaxID=2608716 RepID=UPI0015A04928|nr:hypothetical protein [Mariprofundus sp. NF]NWF38424.1 hypothetical protein [Mariprofundus sp. NF]
MSRSILLITLLVGSLLPEFIMATDNVSPQSEIKRMAAEYKAYKEEARLIVKGKKPLPEYFSLIDRLEGLEEELELLGIILEKESEDFTLLPFEIEAYFNQVGETPLSGYASNGDIVAFSAKIEHPDNEAPHATELFWQLYDANGNPVEGVEKRERTLEAGTTKAYSFRFRLDNLAAGTYKVGLTHYLLENPEVIIQKSVPFKVFDAASIKKIVVTDAPKRFEHKSFLTNDKLPHIYMFYSLAKGVKVATATITVTDAKTGDLITSIAREQPAKKNSFGIRLEKGSYKPEQNFKVTVELQTPDGKVKSNETTFAVGYYQVKLSMPRHLQSSKAAKFRIDVPAHFKAPLTINLSPSNGLILHHKGNALSGTVTGVATDYNLSASLAVTVTDSAGRKGKGMLSTLIQAKPKPKKVLSSMRSGSADGKVPYSYSCNVKRPGYGSIGFTAYVKVQGGWITPVTINGKKGYANKRWLNQFKEIASRYLSSGGNLNLTQELFTVYSDESSERVPHNCLQYAR